jgi:ATP citrate (pro-S)-lyase
MRKRLSEFKAKHILFPTLGLNYTGTSIDLQTQTTKQRAELLENLDSDLRYVVKVDQGVKKRGKLGLLKLNLYKQELELAIKELATKGYSQFLIEEFKDHDNTEERYFSVSRLRAGLQVIISKQGGIEVESAEIVKLNVSPGQSLTEFDELKQIFAPKTITALEQLIKQFDQEYFSFLEINPLLETSEGLLPLDTAVEVDTAGEYFVSSWQAEDFVSPVIAKTAQEIAVAELAATSQASLTLEVLNPDGEFWMLLSGGGASIVLADELYNLGKGELLGNYGEYSGNPNADETEIYALQVLELLLNSKAQHKKLIIAGGVANFTDVRVTFKGIIKAMGAVAQQLRKQKVKVYVRRGGPHQTEGLAMLREFLAAEDLLGEVSGPELALTEIIHKAL